VSAGRAFEYRSDGYWKDVGTPEAYWQAHQDLLSGGTGGVAGLAWPEHRRCFDLDDEAWPIRTTAAHSPPARIDGSASVEAALVSPACRVAGHVVRSVLSPGVAVEVGALVEDAVLLHNVVVRSGARVRRAVVDTGVEVAAGATVGGEEKIEVVSVLS